MRRYITYLLALLLLLAAPAVLAAQELHSRQEKSSLVFYTSTHAKRLIHAIGPDALVYSTDFVNFPDAGSASDPVGWTTTVVEAGAGTTEIDHGNLSGGLMVITTAANDNDGGNYQLLGESFELTSDQILYFGAFGVQASDITESDTFIGLSITDTTILGGATDSIGFRNVDATADLTFVIEKDSTETITTGLATLVAATNVDLEFYFDGTNIEVFVNGVSVATPAVTNLPDNEGLTISWAFLNGAAGAETEQIDRLTVIQVGR